MTEWNPSEYASLSTLQATMAEEVLGLLNLKGAEHILDVGCGKGKTAIEIAARVPNGRVVGVDASADMIAFATAHRDDDAHPNLQFAVADARHRPFTHEFDLVVSFNALHWIPEQALALQSIRAAIKPDGKARLRLVPKRHAFPHAGTAITNPSTIRTSISYPKSTEHSPSSMDFRSSARTPQPRRWDFRTRSAFEAFVSITFVEWTQHHPEAGRLDFVKDVLDRYHAVACDSAGEENFFRFYQMDITLLVI